MTFISTIHQVELSSRCNLACSYCPHPGLRREKADMTMETFEHVIYWAQVLGGPELSFTGMGEAMLNPLFCDMLRQARIELPNVWFLLGTNGLLLTHRKHNERADELLTALRECAVTVFVSTHRPEIAGEAIENGVKAGVDVKMNTHFVDSGFNWAGQVEWHGIAAPRTECQYLRQGWGTVLQDGSVVNCCMDAHGLHPMGNVRDDLMNMIVKPIPLCEHCHLRIPQ
jgi:Radical SAM superfamily